MVPPPLSSPARPGCPQGVAGDPDLPPTGDVSRGAGGLGRCHGACSPEPPFQSERMPVPRPPPATRPAPQQGRGLGNQPCTAGPGTWACSRGGPCPVTRSPRRSHWGGAGARVPMPTALCWRGFSGCPLCPGFQEKGCRGGQERRAEGRPCRVQGRAAPRAEGEEEGEGCPCRGEARGGWRVRRGPPRDRAGEGKRRDLGCTAVCRATGSPAVAARTQPRAAGGVGTSLGASQTTGCPHAGPAGVSEAGPRAGVCRRLCARGLCPAGCGAPRAGPATGKAHPVSVPCPPLPGPSEASGWGWMSAWLGVLALLGLGPVPRLS